MQRHCAKQLLLIDVLFVVCTDVRRLNLAGNSQNGGAITYGIRESIYYVRRAWPPSLIATPSLPVSLA